MSTPPESAALRVALAGAYRPCVVAALRAAGIAEPPGLEAALAEGSAWLRTALDDLLSRPFRQQERGPLEVFQEAMRFPTAALESAGLPARRRDPAAEAALPGDRYGLAPASSRDLGEQVWEAHLAWGAAKARAFRPSVGLLSGDLMDRSRVEPVVAAAGFRLVVWASGDAADPGADRPALALVDLAHPDADGVVARLAAAGMRVVGFGPHVDDLALVRARTLGAADAMPRSVFFRSLGNLLPKPV